MPETRTRRLPPQARPTADQLGLAPRRLLWRGAIGRCPVCGGRHLFRRWFSMAEDCPRCGFHFERVEGHWIGAIAVNTVLVMGAMFVVLMSVSLISFPDPPPRALIFIEVAIAGLGPIVVFPTSRTLWTAMDLLMRPLTPGEVPEGRLVRPPTLGTGRGATSPRS